MAIDKSADSERAPAARLKRHQRPAPEKPGDARMRRCLSCGEEFESQWVGHRICRHCKALNAGKIEVYE